MAKLKPQNMTDAEIEQNLRSLKEELYKLRVEVKSGRIDKPHRIGEAKKNIARCYTILRERKSGGK